MLMKLNDTEITVSHIDREIINPMKRQIYSDFLSTNLDLVVVQHWNWKVSQTTIQ
jgi:hypothetical protein